MPLKVLIVERVTSRQRDLKSLLTALGTRSTDIEFAEDVSAARTLLQRRRFDCCFLSMALPSKNVTALIQEIRSAMVFKSTQLIVYGPAMTEELVVGYQEAGATSILTLPFSLESVEAAVGLASN